MDSLWTGSAFKNVYRAGFRLLFMMLAMGAVAIFFYFDARNPVETCFTETGWIENAQIAALLLAGLFFVYGGRVYPRYRRMAYLLSAPAWLGMIREKDEISDLLFHGAWKVPFAIFFAAALFYAWRHREDVIKALDEFVRLPAWGVLACGFCMTFVFSRIFGMKSNWEAILSKFGVAELLPQAHYTGLVRTVRRAAEEGCELCGYAVIALAALSFAATCRRKARRERIVGK